MLLTPTFDMYTHPSSKAGQNLCNSVWEKIMKPIFFFDQAPENIVWDIIWQIWIWAASWENRIFAYAKTKAQISFAVTAKLISAFVFATRIVYFPFFLYPKFQASSLLLRLYSPVCVGPCRKPRRPVFSRRGSYVTRHWSQVISSTTFLAAE